MEIGNQLPAEAALLSPDHGSESEFEQPLREATSLVARDPPRAQELSSGIMNRALTRQPEGISRAYARALRIHGIACGAAGDLDTCRRELETAHGMALELGDVTLQAQCLHGLANTHYYRGEFALALEQMHQSNRLRRESEDDAGLMSGLNALGACLAEMGDLSDAIDCFTESLEIARRLGIRAEEAVALNNVAHSKLVFGDYDEALRIANESLKITQELGLRVYETFALETVCKLLFAQNRFGEALVYAESSLGIARELQNPHYEVNALAHIAMVHLATEHFSFAEEALLRALAIAKETGSGRRKGELYLSLAELYSKTFEFGKAHAALDRGLTLATERNQKQLICNIHLCRSKLYAASGDYPQALAAHQTYFEHYRALERDSAQNKLVAQLARLEVQRAQQEAEVERIRSGELAEANRRNAELVLRLQERANQLAELAITDPLTGLYNRRYLQQYLTFELDKRNRHPERPMLMAVALADLDNFKQVNDRFSHRVGDEVLKAVARLIQSVVRKSDIVVRFGGEEFVVLFPEMKRHEAMAICERIRIAIVEYDWESVHVGLHVSTSIGIADTVERTFPKEDVTAEMDWLLAMADKRLYRAKELGKNRII